MLTVTHKLFIVLTSVYLDVYVSLICFFKDADMCTVMYPQFENLKDLSKSKDLYVTLVSLDLSVDLYL